MPKQSVPDELHRRIDAACDAFEAEWKSDIRPSLEGYLGQFAEPERPPAFEALLGLELEYRQRLREVISVSEYQERFPQFQQLLLEAFSQQQLPQTDQTRPFAQPASITDLLHRSREGTAQIVRVTNLGPYELMELLGQGGMGTVFKARHTRLNKFVAIKVLPESLMQNQQAVARFDREMKAVGALEHPNIVRAMDADEHQGTHYLVMEYVEGQDAQRFIKSKGPLQIPEACRLIRDAALALEYAHRYGLVHRDIKPSNLLITKDGQLKVLDLGLARLANDAAEEDGLTNTGASLGTPDYMAPEQWNDSHTVDHRTDLYALGCTLYYLLVGRAPFATELYRTVIGKMTAHAQGVIPSLRDARPEVPLELDSLYQHLLAKDVDKRLSSASELVRRIEPFCLAAIPAVERSGATTAKPATVSIAEPSAVREPSAATPVVSAGRGANTRLRSVAPWIVGGIALAALGAFVVTSMLSREGDSKHPLSDSTSLSEPLKQAAPILTAGATEHAEPAVPETKQGWYGWPFDAPPPAIAPFDAEQAKAHQAAWAEYLKVPTEYTNELGMRFRLIPPGEFMMGATTEDTERWQNESEEPHHVELYRSSSPAHRVVVTKPFYFAVHELTNAAYRSLAQTVSDSVVADDLPATAITLSDISAFCSALAKYDQFALTTAYRLPTEAEWEFACRAGSDSNYFFGDSTADLAQFAWYAANSDSKPRSVGQLRPNPFGLFDVNGNVWEWCEDAWSPDYYQDSSETPAIDPVNTTASSTRVFRGGDYGDGAPHCESAVRLAGNSEMPDPMIGYRLVLSLDAVKQGKNSSAPLAATSGRVAELEFPGGWLNLLPLVDLTRDGATLYGKNDWRHENNDLVYESQPGDEWGVMRLPVEILSSNFDMKIEVLPLRGAQGLRIDLPIEGRLLPICFFDASFKEAIKVPRQLDAGTPTTIHLQWAHIKQNARLTVQVTGQPAFEWEGEWLDLSQSDYLNDRLLQPRICCSGDSAFRIRAARLKAVKGRIRVDDPRAAVDKVPEFVDIKPLSGILPEPSREKDQRRWQVLRRHPVRVDTTEWSPDGKWIAASEHSGWVALHDAETGRMEKILGGPRRGLSSLTWQPGGTKLVGCEYEGDAYLWDTNSGSVKRLYRGKSLRAKWSFDGRFFATTGSYGDESVRLWTADGDLVWAVKVGYFNSLAWSRDDQFIFMSNDEDIFTVSVADQSRARIEGPNNGGRLATSVHHDLLAIGRANSSDEDYVELWDYAKHERVGGIPTENRLHHPESIAFSPDGRLLTFTTRSAWLEVFDWNEQRKIRDLSTGLPAHSGSWAPDGSQVCCAIESGPNFAVLPIDPNISARRIGEYPVHRLTRLAPDHQRFVRDAYVGGKHVLSIASSGNSITPAVSPNGSYGWTPDGRNVWVWQSGSGVLVDPATGSVVTRFENTAGEGYATTWSDDSQLLIAGDKSNVIRIWNRGGTERSSIDAKRSKAISLAISPNKQWLAAGFHDDFRNGNVWNLETGEAIGEISSSAGHIHELLWLSDSELLVLPAWADTDVALWTIKDGKTELARTFRAGNHIARKDARNNPWLVTKADLHTIQLTLFDGSRTMVLPSEGFALTNDRLSTPDDGNELSILCSDEVIRTWNSQTGELKRLLVLLPHDQSITFDPTGKVLSQTSKVDEELTYVVEQPDGSLKTLSPPEFRELNGD